MRLSSVTALARASHPAPTVTVTVLAGLLAAAAGAGALTVALVVAAVLTGQLSIGWSNDLIDAARDRAAGRVDKPVATGRLDPRLLRSAVVGVLLLTVALSAGLGWAAGLVHLALVVGSGWAYNLVLKSGPCSFLPYAVAFGSLPSVGWLAAAGPNRSFAPGWMTLAGALLGVGAHLVNALPDLADDEVAGVRGLPHRLGHRWTRLLGPVVLLVGSVVVAFAPGDPVPGWALAALAVCGVAAVVAWTTSGRTPFVAALVMALSNVVPLVLR